MESSESPAQLALYFSVLFVQKFPLLSNAAPNFPLGRRKKYA